MRTESRYLTALKENANLVGLASAVALSAALINPLPLLVGLVAEAAYLVFVPDTKWYEQRLAQKYDAEIVRRRAALKAEVLPTLHPEVQERFGRLEQMRQEIGAQPALDAQSWFREVLRKLDYLLEKFLQFSRKDVQFREYLGHVLEEVRRDADSPRDRSRPRFAGRSGVFSSARELRAAGEDPLRDPSDRWVQRTVTEIQSCYQAELEEVKGLAEKEQDASTRAVLQKRISVLQRRYEYVGKIAKILMNISHQLKLLEDTFGLINDEVRARSPEQVLADIDEVVTQTNTMTDLLDEVAPFEQILERISA